MRPAKDRSTLQSASTRPRVNFLRCFDVIVVLNALLKSTVPRNFRGPLPLLTSRTVPIMIANYYMLRRSFSDSPNRFLFRSTIHSLFMAVLGARSSGKPSIEYKVCSTAVRWLACCSNSAYRLWMKLVCMWALFSVQSKKIALQRLTLQCAWSWHFVWRIDPKTTIRSKKLLFIFLSMRSMAAGSCRNIGSFRIIMGFGDIGWLFQQNSRISQ